RSPTSSPRDHGNWRARSGDRPSATSRALSATGTRPSRARSAGTSVGVADLVRRPWDRAPNPSRDPAGSGPGPANVTDFRRASGGCAPEDPPEPAARPRQATMAHDLLKGLSRFREDFFPAYQEHFRQLVSEGQKP